MTADGKIERRGEFVFVTYKGKTLKAMATLVSENGVSAIIMFDGMLGGYAGMMPILFSGGEYPDGEYRDLIENLPLVVTAYPS